MYCCLFDSSQKKKLCLSSHQGGRQQAGGQEGMGDKSKGIIPAVVTELGKHPARERK